MRPLPFLSHLIAAGEFPPDILVQDIHTHTRTGFMPKEATKQSTGLTQQGAAFQVPVVKSSILKSSTWATGPGLRHNKHCKQSYSVQQQQKKQD